MTFNKTNEIFTYPKFKSLSRFDLKGGDYPLNPEIQLWLEGVLTKQFNDGIKEILHFRSRPWSQVFKVKTNLNNIYFLKVPASEFCQEAQIIGLVEKFNSEIATKIIARDETSGCFLMDSLDGETLRSRIRKQVDQSILVSSAATIGNFQKDAREYISSFEKLGIPKWTAKTIIDACFLLVQNPNFLLCTELSIKEINEFKLLFPSIQAKLIILSSFDNGLSIDHGDFQDNNIFISDYRSVFMDWADASITIPSFSIGTYCHSILLAHPDIVSKSKIIQNILEEYYSNLLGSKYDELFELHITLVHLLYPIICVLKTGRLLNLEDNKSYKYASSIIDYWIRIAISFRGAYSDQSLSN